MPESPMRARAEAASRLPPLASGRRDPDLQVETCHICRARADEPHVWLVLIFGRWMCRDRVDCYKRFKAHR